MNLITPASIRILQNLDVTLSSIKRYHEQQCNLRYKTWNLKRSSWSELYESRPHGAANDE